MTKSEVRAVVLGKLALPVSGVLWDVGAGSASVSVECALLAPGLTVFAVESEPEDASRAAANASAHGVAVHVIEGRAPEVLERLPDPDRVFVGGGGIEVLEAAMARLRPGGRVVATFAALERAAAAAERLGSLVQLNAARGVAAPGWRMAPVGGEPRIRGVGSGHLKVLVVSVTAAGASIAKRLPYEHVHGDAAETIRSRWREYDAFVLVLATGAAVRIVAPLLESKATDPAVVCLDDSGRFAISLLGGHRAGANELAVDVAELVGAEPVITTASERAGIVAIDAATGFEAFGDVAEVSRAMLDGCPIELENRMHWPLPESWERAAVGTTTDSLAPLLVVTDEALDLLSAQEACCGDPPAFASGGGGYVHRSASQGGRAVARRCPRPGGTRRGIGHRGCHDRPPRRRTCCARPRQTGARLFGREPCGSRSSIAERRRRGRRRYAERLGSRSSSRCGARECARSGQAGFSACDRGRGPTPPATGIGRRRRTRPGIVRSPHGGCSEGGSSRRGGHRIQRVRRAGPGPDRAAPAGRQLRSRRRDPPGTRCLSLAAAGRRVALVCSGDAGVYAMASPVLEIASEPEFSDVEVEIVPGVTASLAAGALLGAPLGHDYATVSLSDLLTPWEEVEARLVAAAAADFAVVLYNPRSARRDWQLERARQILLEHRSPATPVGVVTDAGRPAQHVEHTTLGGLDAESVTMTSCVIVGSTSTRMVSGRMVTPRGYRR